MTSWDHFRSPLLGQARQKVLVPLGVAMECGKVREGVVGVSPEYQGVGEGEPPQWEGVGQAQAPLSAQAWGQGARVRQLPSLPPSEVFLLQSPLQTCIQMYLECQLNDCLVLLHWSGAS